MASTMIILNTHSNTFYFSFMRIPYPRVQPDSFEIDNDRFVVKRIVDECVQFYVGTREYTGGTCSINHNKSNTAFMVLTVLGLWILASLLDEFNGI